MYCPQPVDTRDIELPDSLFPLSEALARNIHEVWAQQRIAEGWTYGPCKDGEAKTTPLLIPYEELDENEKAYDRNSVFETLKLITKLGYSIVQLPPAKCSTDHC